MLPLFSAVTVPLCLAGLALPWLGDAMLLAAWWSVRVILMLVDFVAGTDALHFELAPLAPSALAVALLSLLYVLLPTGVPGRRLAWLAMAATVAARPAPLPRDCLDYHVLDVGQGLSVVVRSGRRTVLFDTGPSFRNGGSAAELVILPFLAHLGVARLDAVVVSHADQDHAGGLAAILDAIERCGGKRSEAAKVLGITTMLVTNM